MEWKSNLLWWVRDKKDFVGRLAVLNLLQATYDGFILLVETRVETKLLLTDLCSFLQEHKVSGGPLKSIALFTSARLSVQPVTEGT